MNNPTLDIVALYLDYVNNFLTVERFAEHYEVSFQLADLIISEGRERHELTAKRAVKLIKFAKEQ